MRSPRSTIRSEDALQLEHDAAGARRLWKLEADALALGRDLDALDLVELLDAALHLARLGRLVAEAVDEGLGLLDLLLLAARALAQRLHAGAMLGDVMAVVSVVVRQRAQAHLGDALDDSVEEVAVVRDEHHRAGVVRQVLLEPVARGQVEVVGGLVHQQQVGAGQEQLGERDAHLPAARELLCAARRVLRGEAEPFQYVRDTGVDLVAAQLAEALAHLGVALEQALVVAVLGRVRELVLDRVLLVLERQQVLEGLLQLRPHRAAVVDDAVLGQVADRRVRGHPDAARVRLLEPGQHAQERRLPRAVGSRQANPVPLADVPAHLLEEDAVRVTLAQAFDVDHRRASSGARRGTRAGGRYRGLRRRAAAPGSRSTRARAPSGAPPPPGSSGTR